jgi:hypothetical protein
MNAMEKSCPEAEALACWLEGSLPPQDRARVTSHLAACDDCRRTVAVSSTAEAPPSAALNEVLLQRVVSASRRRRSPVIAFAAAAVVLVALGTVLLRTGGSAPRPSAPVAAEQPPVVAVRPPTPAPLPAEVARTVPAPLPKPAPMEPETPAPVVVAPKETSKPPTPADLPRPADPAPAPKDAPEVVVAPKPPPPPAPEDKGYVPVLVTDPAGDLWLRRGQGEAKAGALEKAAWKDLFAARAGAATFSLEARASVMLEKGAEATFTRVKTDDSYSLSLGQGLVMLDTEGTAQKWRIAFGSSELDFNNLNGRLAVESRGDRMSAMLLDGTAELKIGALAKKAMVGQEVVMSREGQVVEQKGEALKKMARFDELRPKLSMAFAATFDEKKDDLQLFPYKVTAGKLVPGPTGLYLTCEGPPSPRPGEKVTLAGEVVPDRSFGVVSNMVLRFRYRTALPVFSAKLGKHGVEVSVRRPGQWTDAEIPLREFTFEGTPLLPTDPVDGVRFSVSFEKRSGTLDIDGIQFLRRVR